MNQTPIVTSAPRLCGRAILAGSLVALSMHLLLTTLGAGITALAVKPSASDSPVQSFTTGIAITWTLSALISLWIGGFVSGKVGAPGDGESGKLHGFIMWSLATVTGFVLVVAGVGKALGAAGKAAAAAGTAVAAAAPALIERSGAMINDYSGELTQDGKPLPAAGKREVALGLKNLLMNGETGRTAQNRDALVATVARNTKLTPEESARTVDEWTASYDRAASEMKATADAAAAKAKEIADHTATVTGAAGVWTFFAFWVGAVMAAWGGKLGALGCRAEHTSRVETRQTLKPSLG